MDGGFLYYIMTVEFIVFFLKVAKDGLGWQRPTSVVIGGPVDSFRLPILYPTKKKRT